jgi:LDH2 family malate/lactate/ureidoglycolate dehydrogenase
MERIVPSDDFQKAREWCIAIADKEGLGFEVAEQFDHFTNAGQEPWQAATDALIEWDI